MNLPLLSGISFYRNMQTNGNDRPYQAPMVEIVEVKVESGYASSQLPGRDPVIW